MGQANQHNTATSGGTVYATQGGDINIGFNSARQRGLRLDTKVLLVTILADVIFFLYGMLAYTGHDTSGDRWRAGIFLFMFVSTAGMVRRWVRRRA